MWRRCILLLICITMSVCLLTACRNLTNQEEIKLEGEGPVKLLIIGNSHSIDAFYLLYQVFQDQMPDTELVLGVLHYRGCSISKHLAFAQNEKPYYTYLRNTNGQWEVLEDMDMRSVLQDQQWNKIMFQAAKTDLDETLNKADRRQLEDYVSKNLLEPCQYLWHTSWPSPNDEVFFSPAYVCLAPEGYKENLMELYGFDPVNQFAVLTDMAKTHILTDDHYTKAICTGASVMYAHKVLGISQLELWRDYTHLSDFGRLMVAYSLYAQLTGNQIRQVGVETIPTEMRHLQYQYLGDLKITPQMQQIIVQGANHSLEDPWTVPTGK